MANAEEPREPSAIEAVAPYVHAGYNADAFIEQLTRLVEASPDGVSEVLGRVLETHAPVYDYEGL